MVWKFIKDFFKGFFISYNSVGLWFGAVSVICLWLLPTFNLGDEVDTIIATISLPYRLLILLGFIFISVILTSYSLYKKPQKKTKDLQNTLVANKKPFYNPYKQLLATGTADVQWTAQSNSNSIASLLLGYITLEKGRKVFLKMDSVGLTESERIGNDQKSYKTLFELDNMDNSIGKPIHNLSQADFTRIYLEHLNNMIPHKSKITGGLVIFTLNSSVRIEIPIPSQIIDRNEIVIPEIGKYFKRKN